MGSRLSSSKRGRPEQCRLLVQPRRQARLPRTTRCGMAEHRNSFAEIVTAAVTDKGNNSFLRPDGCLGPSIRKALKRPVIVVLASRSADANWSETALQETAHSAKTIILDDSDQRTSISAGWQSGM